MQVEISVPPSPSEPDATPDAGRNADFAWERFDPEGYFQHYYAEPHRDDDSITRYTAKIIAEISGAAEDLDIVDVGTGPNLIPFLCACPRAKSLTAWEFSQSNVDWLARELQRPSLRGPWQHFWSVAQSAYGPGFELAHNPVAQIAAKATLTRASIFDLPRHRWDAATMFFCAESITSRADEFEAAIAAFAGCVRPGGTLIAAFLVQSDGYEVEGRRFPALKLSVDAIEATLGRFALDVKARPIGIVDEEVRSGYSGCAFLTARTRS